MLAEYLTKEAFNTLDKIFYMRSAENILEYL